MQRVLEGPALPQNSRDNPISLINKTDLNRIKKNEKYRDKPGE
jgi:hypothetical protein